MTLDIVETTVPTPLGSLRLLASAKGLCGIYFETHKKAVRATPFVGQARAHPILGQAMAQLEEYFAGHRHDFELLLDTRGTTFQHRVWEQLRAIPFGQTVTYGQIAERLEAPDFPAGSPRRKARAVGMANARNPLSIVVPCHRVVGVNGKLTGYAGGVKAKQWLLRHEQGLLVAAAERS